MTAATTSAINYREHKNAGKVGAQAETVLALLKASPEPMSRLEIAEALGMRLSSVCGRVNELIADRYIKPAESRRCKISGKTICPVKAIEGVGHAQATDC